MANQPTMPGEQNPQEGHGGSNVKGSGGKAGNAGKEGNGAQKLKQQKKR